MGYQWPAKFSWNYDRGEIIADSVIHAMGICLGLIGAVIIIVLVAPWQVRTKKGSSGVESVVAQMAEASCDR